MSGRDNGDNDDDNVAIMVRASSQIDTLLTIGAVHQSFIMLPQFTRLPVRMLNEASTSFLRAFSGNYYRINNQVLDETSETADDAARRP